MEPNSENIKKELDFFFEKIHLLNINMCHNFNRLMEKGFWRAGCLEKLRVLLAWLDNDSTCWFRYRRLMQVFRNRLHRLLINAESWSKRQRSKPCRTFLHKPEIKILQILERTPWKDASIIIWQPTEKFHESKSWIKLSSISPSPATTTTTIVYKEEETTHNSATLWQAHPYLHRIS